MNKQLKEYDRVFIYSGTKKAQFRKKIGVIKEIKYNIAHVKWDHDYGNSYVWIHINQLHMYHPPKRRMKRNPSYYEY